MIRPGAVAAIRRGTVHQVVNHSGQIPAITKIDLALEKQRGDFTVIGCTDDLRDSDDPLSSNHDDDTAITLTKR